MRRLLLTLTVLALGLAGCGSDSGAGGDTRTVLADYNHDEFATSYFGYFPRNVEVHPGDKIVFRQAWTGEPHTVTMGQIVEPLGSAMAGYLDGTKPIPDEEPQEVIDAAKGIPGFFGEEEDSLDLVQTGAQPCYVADVAGVPQDGKPCPQLEEQPEFNGRQAFYNSGFIPYEGNNGNKFEVQLADDIATGDYFYFCLIHGSIMGGYINVKPETEEIPGQSEVNKVARDQLDEATERLTKAHESALKGTDRPDGVDVVAGTEPMDELKFPIVLSFEFYPRRFRAKVDDTVTWAANGHTISFNVPKYGPQVIIEDDGTVKLNPSAYEPQNAPEPPEMDFENEDAPPPVQDAGTYVEGKYISSGLSGAQFKLKFTKAGTYKYACVVHPRMIGEVVVS